MAPGPIAAAAKSRQSCPTLCDPHRRKPTRLLCPWDSPGENTAWQIEGGKLEVVADFLFLGSKITADGDYSHETSRQLLLDRKVMTNLDGVLKSRDTTLYSQCCGIVKPVVSYSCESWTVKNTECQIIDAFELLKTPESPMDSKERSNQSILREVNPEYSLEGLMLKLKF